MYQEFGGGLAELFWLDVFNSVVVTWRLDLEQQGPKQLGTGGVR